MVRKRRKPTKKPRKKPEEKPVSAVPTVAVPILEINEVVEKVSRDVLRQRLKESVAKKKLFRTSRVSRDQEMEDIEDRLDEKISGKERKVLKERLKLLEEVEEKHLENSLVPGDFQDAYYGNISGGGAGDD